MYSFISLCNTWVPYYLKEIPFDELNWKTYKDKLKQCYEVIKTYKLYYIFLILFLVRGTPSLLESTEYFLTYRLKFSTFLFGIFFVA